MLGLAVGLSLRHIFGQGDVCQPGCTHIGLFTNFHDCPVCGGASEKDLTKPSE